MAEDFIHQLTTQSTLAELPAYGLALDVGRRGKEIGQLFDKDPNLPGVVITQDGTVRSVLSRGQYLRLVSRNFGHEVFDPRPIQLMLDTLDANEQPLILSAEIPIQEAVGRALTRPRGLIYEPIIVRADGSAPSNGNGWEGLGVAVVDFPDLLRADSRISALRNLQMQQILATVEEGFLMVDGRHVIASEHSASLERIFGTDHLTGLTLPNFLSPFLGREKADLCSGFLATLFNPNVIEKLVADINPLLKVEIETTEGESKFLRFRFVRGLEDGAIRRVLVKIEDITREVLLAEERQADELKTRERMTLILEVVRADPGSLTTFLSKVERELAVAEALVDPEVNGEEPAGRLARLYRLLHGLKGEAGLLGLQSFQKRIHRAEDRLSQIRTDGEPSIEDLTALQEELLILKHGFVEIQAAIDQLQSLDRKRPGSGEAEPGAADGVESSAVAATPPPPPAPRKTLLKELALWVPDQARRLGKQARFFTKVEEEDFPERYLPFLREALVQLARNSLVHGIETPETRRSAGKPTLGTLQVAVRSHEQSGQLEVIFQDDGRGLDVDRIVAKAQRQGIEVADRAQALQLIFAPGFSTARSTDLDAGRGVGLDLVQARLKELGGRIIPHSEFGAYCAFQILLPL